MTDLCQLPWQFHVPITWFQFAVAEHTFCRITFSRLLREWFWRKQYCGTQFLYCSGAAPKSAWLEAAVGQENHMPNLVGLMKCALISPAIRHLWKYNFMPISFVIHKEFPVLKTSTVPCKYKLKLGTHSSLSLSRKYFYAALTDEPKGKPTVNAWGQTSCETPCFGNGAASLAAPTSQFVYRPPEISRDIPKYSDWF